MRAHAKSWDAFVKSDRVMCEEAIADARAALAIDPDSTLALNALALALFQSLARGIVSDRDSAFREGLAAATRSIGVDRGEVLHALLAVLEQLYHRIEGSSKLRFAEQLRGLSANFGIIGRSQIRERRQQRCRILSTPSQLTDAPDRMNAREG